MCHKEKRIRNIFYISYLNVRDEIPFTIVNYIHSSDDLEFYDNEMTRQRYIHFESPALTIIDFEAVR
jgi:hypothetical protein